MVWLSIKWGYAHLVLWIHNKAGRPESLASWVRTLTIFAYRQTWSGIDVDILVVIYKVRLKDPDSVRPYKNELINSQVRLAHMRAAARQLHLHSQLHLLALPTATATATAAVPHTRAHANVHTRQVACTLPHLHSSAMQNVFLRTSLPAGTCMHARICMLMARRCSCSRRHGFRPLLMFYVHSIARGMHGC